MTTRHYCRARLWFGLPVATKHHSNAPTPPQRYRVFRRMGQSKLWSVLYFLAPHERWVVDELEMKHGWMLDIQLIT